MTKHIRQLSKLQRHNLDFSNIAEEQHEFPCRSRGKKTKLLNHSLTLLMCQSPTRDKMFSG